MPNAIKYNTSAETLALKKGNFWIGTGAVGKGPTSTTGYYNGITPPSGGYTIYLNKASGGPSIYTVNNDSQLIGLTNSIAGASYTTAQQCFDYYYGQNDKVLFNQDYPTDFPYIVMDGLVLYLDAGISQSYPGSGTAWTDINGLGPKNNGTLINGPTYSSSNGGSIVFDGTDDYVESGVIEPTTITLCALFKPTGEPSNNDSAGGTIIVNSPQLVNNAVQYAIAYSWVNQRVIFSLQSNTEFLPTPDNSVLRNQTHYIVATFDGTNRNIYINGVNVASDVRAVSINYPTSGNRNVQVGRWGYAGFSRIINGNLYSASIYNRALTSQEALQNYQAQIPQLIGENIVGNGLVLYLDAGYQPSYPTSGSTWYDISGKNNNGILTNGPTYSSANGGTIVFDGVDDYMITQQITGYKSLCFWVLWTGTGPLETWQYLLDARTGMNAGWFVPSAYSMGSDWNTTFYVNGVSTSTLSPTTVPKNRWLHIYLVGVNDSYTSTINFMSRYSNNEQAGGKIGVISVYNRALSIDEIQQNFNAQKGRYGL